MQTFRQFLRRRRIRFGARSDRDLRFTEARHAQFASFLEQSGFRPHNVDRYERSLQRRRFGKVVLLVGAGIFIAWIALESAHALVMFW